MPPRGRVGQELWRGLCKGVQEGAAWAQTTVAQMPFLPEKST